MADREKVIEHLMEIAEYFRECRSNASFASKAENHFWELQNAASEAAELLKSQEPRVMLIKELEDTDEPVFIELRTKEEGEEKLTCFGLLEHWDDLAFHFIADQWLLDGKPFFRIYGCELKRKEYNIQWRPWNKRPTIEQMKAVKWE